MPTRNIVISQEQQQLIKSLVESGRYQNASEVLRGGLRMLQRRDVEESAKLAALRSAADAGWAAYATGDYVAVETEDDTAAMWQGIDLEVDERSAQLRK